MSAKGRKRADGVVALPPPNEFFETPAWCVDRLLKHRGLPAGAWLEPSAGNGAIIRAINTRRAGIAWTAVELREEAAPCFRTLAVELHVTDFLRWNPQGRRFVVTIGNPPFSLAAQMISHALTFSSRVVFLLRQSFLESEERIPFFRRVGVPDVMVLPDRPSFTGSGTDSASYAWMEFRPEWAGRDTGSLKYLPPDDVVNQLSLV